MNFNVGRMSIESIREGDHPPPGCWIKLHDSADLIRNKDRVRRKTMRRKQDGLVPIREAFGSLNGPVKAIRETSRQARRGFTVADQVDRLVWASEAAQIAVSWRA